MKWFRVSLIVCLRNFRKWATNYRIWTVALLAIILTHSFSKGYTEFCTSVGMKITPWIFVFLFAQRIMKILFFLPLILVLCDAPFISDDHPYLLMRSKRLAWGTGQILYVLIATGLYFLFIFLLSVLLNLPWIEFSAGWGKVFGTLGGTNAAQAMELSPVFVNQRTLHYFVPVQAAYFTFALSWASGVFLGLLIYALNSITNNKGIGVAAACFFLVFDAAFSKYPVACRFSPVTWSTLSLIDIGNTTDYPSIRYIVFGYGFLILLLIGISIFANLKQEIHVRAPV
jgi:hypothetical protein